MNQCKTVLLLILLAISSTAIYSSNKESTQSFKKIALTDPNLHVLGANYSTRTPNKLTYSRFSTACLNAPAQERMFNAKKAKTCSGIRIQFATKASELKLTFSPEEGLNRGAEFAVLQNNQMTNTFAFNAKQSKKEMVLHICSKSPGTQTVYEVVLPSFCNVALTTLELKDGELSTYTPPQKPIYLAIGNSITHGVGQGSATYLTYPYLLAKKLDVNYFNLAVGGAKISQAVAKQLAEMPQADMITILIGYNDLMFDSKSVEEYVSAYTKYLTTIRANQPKAKIYCISLTHTRASGNSKTNIVPEDYRKALKHLVQDFKQKGDNNLVFVAGDAITSEANLRQQPTKDKVHFSIEGASLFADALYKIMKN